MIGTPAGGNLGPGTLDAEGKIHSDDSFDAAALNTDGVVYTATASGTYVGGWGRGGLNGNGYKFESADDFSWYTGNTAPDTGGTLRMRLSLTGGLTVNDVSISSTPPTCDGYSDYFSGTIAVGSKNFHSSARTFVVGDVGKLITISSAGGVQSFSSGAISAPGTGYVPAQTITLTGGTETSNAVVDVLTTKVVSATVAAGGASGTPGTQTVTGTTGAGNKFTASVTVSGGGAITAVLSITAGGSYTTNPTSLTTEPVTGAGLVGAQLNVVMGVNTVAGHAGSLGSYTVVPASPVAQGSSSGSGTGATVTAAWMGNALVSSITAFTDAHDVVLNDTAVSTATGVTWGYGSDYSAQIQAGLAHGVQLPALSLPPMAARCSGWAAVLMANVRQPLCGWGRVAAR